MSKVVFNLPISTDKELGSEGGGQIVCTEEDPQVFLLTFGAPPDNRLTTAFCQAFIAALDIIEHRLPHGVVITTSAIPKFYSNGMDIEHSIFTAGYMPNVLYKLWHRLLTYSRPTIAVFNGHAFAGGLMLGMMHDYRIMNPHKGFLCLNELQLGMPLRPPMTAIFRTKVHPNTLRKLVLEAHRFKALEALQEGIIDHVGGVSEALVFIREMELVGKAQPGATGVSVYGLLKREMWRETVDLLENWATESVREVEVRERLHEERECAAARVDLSEKRWKAKL